ncbi:MAG: TonB-dependent receptor [Pseudomonadota bacterium]
MRRARPYTNAEFSNRVTDNWSYKLGLLAAAAAVLFSGGAFAQVGDASKEDGLEELVVTGSRIERDGYTSATPTTVVGQELIQQRAIVNIGDALNKVPSFRAAVTPNAGGIGNSGAFLADLRGLGPSRTLVLLDRGRMPQTLTPGIGNSAGTTDLNVIPTVLIKSADVVTGGASAAYGSDAVAGVINFMIDDRLQGLKGSAQYGETRYGDSENTHLSLAGGTGFAADRGHAVLGIEYNKNSGTGIYNDQRAWGRENWDVRTFAARPAGTPFTLLGPNGNFFGAATSGGLILSPGPLQGLAFVSTPSGGVATAPFARGLGNLATGLDVFTDAALAANKAAGIYHGNLQQLQPSQERYNVLAKATFALTDHVSAYVEPLYSRVTTVGSILARRDGAGAGPALTIARDNYYLSQALTPAQLALVPAAGLSLGYSGTQFGPNYRDIQKDLVRIQTGIDGDFGGSWKWDAAYIYGQSTAKVAITNNFNNVNFRNALDAISSNGQVVCRSAVATAAGCVPINILGAPIASAAARSYILGTSTGEGDASLQDVSANLQGEPFSTWAGPVSVATGIEYREDTIEITVDPLAQAGGTWLSAAGSPLVKVKQDVKEGYVETVVPFAKDLAFARSLDLNGAVRVTDYSTSGGVTTWKAGLTWEPVDGVLVRTTRSRDIRAPNLIELYTPQVQSLPLPQDPRPTVPRPTNTAGFLTGGNPNLKPEKSITQTLGVSYQPGFFQKLKLSVDFYDIQIDDAIASTGTQGVINNCFIGGVYTGNSWCSLITFANNDSVNGQITGAQGVTANVATFSTKGLDIQATYRQPLAEISPRLAGDLTLNLMGTHVISFKSSTDVSTLFPNGIDRAGQTGAAFGGAAGLPSWLLNAALNYKLASFGMNANVRYISKSKQNNGAFGPDDPGYNPALTTSINNNNIPAVTYVDLGIAYDFGGKKQRELFFNIDNAFDKDPPLPAPGTAYYDNLGRTFKGGVRFSF